jgi:hypothetical protein
MLYIQVLKHQVKEVGCCPIEARRQRKALPIVPIVSRVVLQVMRYNVACTLVDRYASFGCIDGNLRWRRSLRPAAWQNFGSREVHFGMLPPTSLSTGLAIVQ